MARGMKNYSISKPEKITLGGIDWTEQYGCYRATLNGWLEIRFNYTKDAYEIYVADRLLKGQSTTPEEAAKLAIRAARLWCVRVIEKIDEIGKNESPTV